MTRIVRVAFALSALLVATAGCRPTEPPNSQAGHGLEAAASITIDR